MACIDQRLRRKGSSVEALVRRGVKPSAARLIVLRSSCRQFVEGVQTDTAPALAGNAPGSPTPTIRPSNPTESRDTRARPPSSSEPVAEEHVQQGNVELNNSVSEKGVLAWLSAAFRVAVVGIVTLLVIVIYLFIRWRNTGQRTISVSAPEKNSDGAGNAPLEITIEAVGELLADKTIQLPDQTGEGAATSPSQNSAYSSKIQSTNEEALPENVSIEPSDSNATGSSAVENVAQLAKLCAMGTPSEKDFQRIKRLISQSLGDAQEA